MTHAALGAALYFDHELATDPAPFVQLVEAVFGSAPADLRQFYVPLAKRKASAPAPLDVNLLVRRISEGVAFSAAVETAPGTVDDAEMRVSAKTAPAGTSRSSQTACRYDLDAHIGAARLDRLGVGRVVDALIAFADAVDVRAGVVLWAETTIFAACLASCSASSRLSRDQDRRVLEAMDGQSRWGERVRGPAWGTFLGAAHVETLGGLARVEREAPCARVVGLHAGGAFLQATAIDAPIVEGAGDAVMSKLARYLEPVV